MPADPDPQAPSRRLGADGVIVLSCGHLLAFVDRAKVAGALPAIRQQIVMSDQAAAWVIGTAFALGYGITLMALALVHPFRVVRWRLIAGLALWGGASAATGMAATLPSLIACRALLGVGQALFIPAALTGVLAIGGARNGRAKALAQFTAASSLGRSTGLLAFGIVLAGVQWAGIGGARDAWRWSFFLTVLPNLVVLTVLVGGDDGAARDQAHGAGGSAVPRRAQAAYLLLAIAPIMLLQATVGWLPTLFVAARGLTPQQASIWLGVVAVISGPGGPVAGAWLMRARPGIDRSIPLLVAAAMTTALPCFGLIVWGGAPIAVTVGVALVQLILGIAAFLSLLGWQNMMSLRQRMAGNGVFLALITTIGVGLGPLLTGALADRHSLAAAMIETAIACIALSIGAAAIAQPLYSKFRLT